MEDESQEDFLFKKNALAMRLQQRRPRKVLAEQGIIPPLKSPGTYFPQIQRLERARKEDYLNHAMQMRPNRDMLVQQHILEDTSACNSTVTNQKDLKKAQLFDNLNDKIAFRPGVIELVERNIIPATDDVQEAIKGGHIHYKKIADFTDEDSSGDALSPEQQVPLPASPPLFQLTTGNVPSTNAQSSSVYATKNDAFNAAKSSIASSLFTQSNTHPYLSRQTSKSSNPSKGGIIPKIVNARKKKDKPKIKKLKYHQYVPVDQQGKSTEKNAPARKDDTPYARLLEQQQLYLQFQIMNNQANTHGRGDSQQQPTFSQRRIGSSPPPPPPNVDKSQNRSSSLTQSKLDDMKVAELKEELKSRGKKVTGTKEVLVERLKPFCLSPDSTFMSNIDENNADFSMGGPSMLPDGRMVNERHSMHHHNSQMLGNPGSSNIQSNFPGSSKLARMPTPERHEVVVKQEKVMLPTWHHAGEAHGMQPNMAANQPGSFVNENISKDKLLEKQQKQINDLKRMVELHRSQLQHLHNHKPATRETVQVMTKPLETARVSSTQFQFPTSSNTNQQQPVRQTLSNQIPPVPAPRRQIAAPPKYEQACEMMKDGQVSNLRGSNADVEDLLEFLTDTGELPTAPVVTRVPLNDHESYHGINNRTVNPHQEAYPQHPDYVPQEQPQLRREVHQNQLNRRSQEFPNSVQLTTQYPAQCGRTDLAQMLVDSAGDALMDTSNFPPAAHRYSNPNLDQQIGEYSRGSGRNSIDSGVMYSTPHFSPMDTSNMESESLRLSSSSIDSIEPTLNAVSLPPATPPRMKHHHSSHPYRQRSSNRPIHHNLVKSASQELLSTNQNPPANNNNPMHNELGWLDLTLGSAVGGPPSPGNPFEMMGRDGRPLRHYQHSNPVSIHGSHDNDLNLYTGDSSGNLNLHPNTNTMDPQTFDLWGGILNPNFNS